MGPNNLVFPPHPFFSLSKQSILILFAFIILIDVILFQLVKARGQLNVFLYGGVVFKRSNYPG